MAKLLDYVFLSRPVLLAPVWTIFLLGYHRSISTNRAVNPPLLILVLLTFLSASIYIINQICDMRTDRINRKLFLLADRIISQKKAMAQAIIFALVSVIPAFVISPTLGILFALGLALGLIYSLPPMVLKNRPIGGLLCNALGHGSLVFLIGWCANSRFSSGALVYSIPYLLAVGAIYLNTTIPDKEGDRKSGKITLAVKRGDFFTKLVSVVFCFLSFVFSVILRDYPLLIVALFSVFLFVYMLFTESLKTVTLVTKLSVFGLSVAAGIFHAWYFILLLSLYTISRIYYKVRFGMNYPTLLGQ